ncbi:PP2Cc [Musa troglodytarum]|uniref:protein-serine/threonine phosphatase n=1 Tax=Musa troglodytarum TaxID=320322 RepID=A0A9E7EJF8_9LILI|nr:PP2Cc [Musa troglodytarum]
MAASRVEKMASEGDSPENCRETRRQRIQMRILEASGEGAAPPSRKRDGKRREAHEEPETSGFSVSEKRNRVADGGAPSPRPRSSYLAVSLSSSTSSASDGELVSPAIGSTSGSVPAVAFGSISLAGRSREMEDAVSIQPDFFRPERSPSIHFFAVFDGHGGSHVAALCKAQMHVLLAEELGRAETETERDAEAEEARIKMAVGRSFARMDEMALMACACGTIGVPPCGCERSGTVSEIVGSTAVVALVGGGRLVVANCGDSRAVLSRGGRAVPLSDDHKPDRPDELARIEAAGGRVIYLNGARVYGILAMSRALGDKYLKPAVISEPEIRVVETTAADECLIIASDGLWDVLPNDLACDVARRCLEEAEPTRGSERLLHEDGGDTAGGPEKEHASDARCSLAAALLARLALGRRSADNISVVVVDLRRTRGWSD